MECGLHHKIWQKVEFFVAKVKSSSKTPWFVLFSKNKLPYWSVVYLIRFGKKWNFPGQKRKVVERIHKSFAFQKTNILEFGLQQKIWKKSRIFRGKINKITQRLHKLFIFKNQNKLSYWSVVYIIRFGKKWNFSWQKRKIAQKLHKSFPFPETNRSIGVWFTS